MLAKSTWPVAIFEELSSAAFVIWFTRRRTTTCLALIYGEPPAVSGAFTSAGLSSFASRQTKRSNKHITGQYPALPCAHEWRRSANSSGSPRRKQGFSCQGYRPKKKIAYLTQVASGLAQWLAHAVIEDAGRS